jgi:hypothetical protein
MELAITNDKLAFVQAIINSISRRPVVPIIIPSGKYFFDGFFNILFIIKNSEIDIYLIHPRSASLK